MNITTKEKLESFLMNEDVLNENTVNSPEQLELPFLDEDNEGEKQINEKPIIIDRKVITESGKILLKD